MRRRVAASVANGGGGGTVARECRRQARFLLGCDAGCERLGGVAGGHGDGAVGRDADRELGIDEVEAFGAQVPHQQAVPDSLTSAFGALATMAWS